MALQGLQFSITSTFHEWKMGIWATLSGASSAENPNTYTVTSATALAGTPTLGVDIYNDASRFASENTLQAIDITSNITTESLSLLLSKNVSVATFARIAFVPLLVAATFMIQGVVTNTFLFTLSGSVLLATVAVGAIDAFH